MSDTNSLKAAPGRAPNRWALLRYERGETIAEVAEGSGVSASTIARLEGSTPYRPGSATIHALARFYRVSVAELLQPATEAHLEERTA